MSANPASSFNCVDKCACSCECCCKCHDRNKGDKREKDVPWKPKLGGKGPCKPPRLIGWYRNLQEKDNIEILYPGHRDERLLVRINGHLEFNSKLPRRIKELRCVKKIDKETLKDGTRLGKITLFFIKVDGEDEWPSIRDWDGFGDHVTQ